MQEPRRRRHHVGIRCEARYEPARSEREQDRPRAGVESGDRERQARGAQNQRIGRRTHRLPHEHRRRFGHRERGQKRKVDHLDGDLVRRHVDLGKKRDHE